MGTNELRLTRAQAGIESSRGVAVAATRKVYAQLTGTYNRPMQTFPDTSGTYFDRHRPAYGIEEIGFTALDMGTFEDLPWWAKHFMNGAVVPVGDDHATAEAFDWLFSPAAETDNLVSSTWEFNEKGNPYESDQVMVTQATLRMNVSNNNEPAWMLDVTMIGRTWVPTTFTVALSDRETEVILARGSKLYIDNAGGTIGTTQVLGKLISASFTFIINRHFKNFGEDENNYAPGKTGRGAYQVDAQFQFEFDDDDEFANYRSSTPVERLVRISREGTLINDTPTRKLMQLDLHRMYWTSFSRADRNGNLVANFGAQAFYSPGEAALVELLVRNALATLP